MRLGAAPLSRRRLMLLAGVGIMVGVAVVLALGVTTAGLGESAAYLRTRADDVHIVGPRTVSWRAASRLRRADAAADAQRAVHDGDTRLLGGAGVGAVVPGVADLGASDLIARGGVRFLYSGCVVDSPEEESYREAAYRYAELYNAQMLALVPVPSNLGLQRAAPSRRR